MQKFISAIFVLLIFLTGCITNAPKGDVQNKVYVAPTGEFSISLPPASLLRVNETERGGLFAVDFFTGSLNPKSRLVYAVEWYKIPSKKIGTAFYKDWVKNIPTVYLTGNFGEHGEYDFLEGKQIVTNNGHNGYVFVGSGVHNDVSKPRGSIYGITIDYGDYISTIYTLNHNVLTEVKDINDLPKFEAFSTFFNSFERR